MPIHLFIFISAFVVLLYSVSVSSVSVFVFHSDGRLSNTYAPASVVSLDFMSDENRNGVNMHFAREYSAQCSTVASVARGNQDLENTKKILLIF